jgi:hypothetical protein
MNTIVPAKIIKVKAHFQGFLTFYKAIAAGNS